MLVVIPEMKTESLSSWTSYETKSALRHHRISQHLQVSCRLVNSLNLKILMNFTLKCVLPRVIARACGEHTLLRSNGGAVLPLGFPTSDAARAAGLPARCSSGMCLVQSCSAGLLCSQSCCPPLVHGHHERDFTVWAVELSPKPKG